MENSIMNKIIIATTTLLVSSMSLAATDGSLGTTSAGDFGISTVIEDVVQISNLNDVDLGNFSGSGDLANSDAFCLYRNGGGTLNITASGSGSGGAFSLSDGANDIPFSVEFTDETSTAAALSAGTALNAVPNTNVSSLDCSGIGGDNNSIEIRISEADAIAASAGTYTGTLFLTVAPE